MRRGNLLSLDYLWWHLWRRCQALARDGRLEAFADDRGRPRVEGAGGVKTESKKERGERDIHVIGGWLVPRSLYKTMGIFNRTEGPFRRVSNSSHCPLVHFLSCPSPLSISGNSAPQPHPAAYPLLSLPTASDSSPFAPRQTGTHASVSSRDCRPRGSAPPAPSPCCSIVGLPPVSVRRGMP